MLDEVADAPRWLRDVFGMDDRLDTSSHVVMAHQIPVRRFIAPVGAIPFGPLS